MNMPAEKGKRDLKKIMQGLERAEGLRRKSNVVSRFEFCHHFYVGDQHVVYDSYKKKVVPHPTLQKRMYTMNVIRPQGELHVARVTEVPVRLEVTASKDDTESAELSRAKTGLLDYWHDELNFDSTDERTVRWMTIFGKSFKHAWWDNSAYSYIARFVSKDDPVVDVGDAEDVSYITRRPYCGRYIDVFYGRFGEFKVDDVLPSRILVEPGIDSLRDANRFYTVSVRTLAWVKERFGKNAAQVEAEPIEDRYAGSSSGAYSGGDDAIDGSSYSIDAGLVVLKECFEKLDGRWRRTVFVKHSKANQNGLILNPDEPTLAHHGYIEYEYLPEPDTFWSRGFVHPTISLQRALNQALTTAIESNKFASKPALISANGMTPKVTVGENCFYYDLPPLPNATPPQWATTPDMSGASIEMVEKINGFIDLLTNSHDVNSSTIAKGSSGVAIAELVQEQQVSPDKTRRELTRGNTELAKAMLMMARELYNAPRLVNLFSNTHTCQVVVGQELSAVSHVTPVAASIIPRSTTAKMAAIEQWEKMGLFEEGNENKARRVFDLMNAQSSDMAMLLPATKKVQGQVNRALDALEAGEITLEEDFFSQQTNPETGQPEPGSGQIRVMLNGEALCQEWHDHQAFLLAYYEFMMSERYFAEWEENDDARSVLRALVSEHREYLELQTAPPEEALPQGEGVADAGIPDEAMVAALSEELGIAREQAAEVLLKTKDRAAELVSATAA